MESTTVFTFNGSPLGFSAQQPPPIDLILLVTAHHSKRNHLLFNRAHRYTMSQAGTCFWQLWARPASPRLPPTQTHDTHPDLIIDLSVLGILVKFLLRVNIDAVGSQLFPDL